MDDPPLINDPPAAICDEDLLKDRLDCDDPDLEVEDVEKRGKNLADEFLRTEIEEGLKKVKQFNCLKDVGMKHFSIVLL